MSIALEVVLGAILSIIITIWIELTRKPKLEIRVAPSDEMDYDLDKPARHARFLRLLVENKTLPLWLTWIARNAASQCSCDISFHHLDGKRVFSTAMRGRWAGSSEPTPVLSIQAEQVVIENITLSSVSDLSTTRRDIYPGDIEALDVVARFDQDEECYGWNDEAYLSNPLWRNPKWKLSHNRYFVKVTAATAGDKVTRLFLLSNDVSIEDFRLEEASKDDYKSFL